MKLSPSAERDVENLLTFYRKSTSGNKRTRTATERKTGKREPERLHNKPNVGKKIDWSKLIVFGDPTENIYEIYTNKEPNQKASGKRHRVINGGRKMADKVTVEMEKNFDGRIEARVRARNRL